MYSINKQAQHSVITVGYEAHESSLILYRYDMWMVGTYSLYLLATASSIISPKRGTPHPINILGSSNNFEGLKLSKLCNRMGVSKIGTPNFYSLSWLILILPKQPKRPDIHGDDSPSGKPPNLAWHRLSPGLKGSLPSNFKWSELVEWHWLYIWLDDAK